MYKNRKESRVENIVECRKAYKSRRLKSSRLENRIENRTQIRIRIQNKTIDHQE